MISDYPNSANEAIEQAHRHGNTLTAASLMVAGPAAADAVRRARAMPTFGVGSRDPGGDRRSGGAGAAPDPRPGRRARLVSLRSVATWLQLFLSPARQAAAPRGNPRAVRGVRRHRPAAGPRQCAQAHASPSHHRTPAGDDRPASSDCAPCGSRSSHRPSWRPAARRPASPPVPWQPGPPLGAGR